MSMRKGFPLGVVSVVFSAISASVVLAATVEFDCQHPKDTTCYFTTFSGASMSNFTLKGGESDGRGGLSVGRDTYCVDTEGPNKPDCKRQTIRSLRVIAKP